MIPAVSALVVSYRTGPRLAECLYALRGDPDISEIVIADNGNPPSAEEWIDRFVAATPKAKLVRLPNPGFGAGVNAAARLATGEHVLVINPDCVLKRGAAGHLIRALDGAPPVSIAGGRIFDLQGREERGARRNTLTLARALGFGQWTLEQEPLPQGPIRVGAISGAFFLMRKDGFDRLGGFDEGYFLHVEDVDLCRRALEAGGEVIFVLSMTRAALWLDLRRPISLRHWAQGEKPGALFPKFAKGPLERLVVEAAVPFTALR